MLGSCILYRILDVSFFQDSRLQCFFQDIRLDDWYVFFTRDKREEGTVRVKLPGCNHNHHHFHNFVYSVSSLIFRHFSDVVAKFLVAPAF